VSEKVASNEWKAAVLFCEPMSIEQGALKLKKTVRKSIILDKGANICKIKARFWISCEILGFISTESQTYYCGPITVDMYYLF